MTKTVTNLSIKSKRFKVKSIIWPENFDNSFWITDWSTKLTCRNTLKLSVKLRTKLLVSLISGVSPTVKIPATPPINKTKIKPMAAGFGTLHLTSLSTKGAKADIKIKDIRRSKITSIIKKSTQREIKKTVIKIMVLYEMSTLLVIVFIIRKTFHRALAHTRYLHAWSYACIVPRCNLFFYLGLPPPLGNIKP